MTMGCCFTRLKSRSITGLEEVDRLIPQTLEQSGTYSARGNVQRPVYMCDIIILFYFTARIPSIRNNVLDSRLCTVTWRQLQPTVGGLSVADIRVRTHAVYKHTALVLWYVLVPPPVNMRQWLTILLYKN